MLFRSSAVAQLGDKPKAIAWLAKTLQAEKSYAVRNACIGALGKLEAKDQVELLLKMTGEPSRQQELQQAALGVMAGWGEAKAIEPAMKAAALGNFDRARPAAMDALAKLCPKEEDNASRKAIIEKLMGWMDDPEGRARNAACEALASVKAKQALDRLDAIARSDPSAERRDRAAEWAKRIRS